jgi:hypothetical protein
MIEEILPAMVSLSALFTNLERVYPNDARLLTAYDRANRPCIIAIEPQESVRVARFPSEAERDTWLAQVKASALGRRRSSNSGSSGGALPATVALWKGRA